MGSLNSPTYSEEYIEEIGDIIMWLFLAEGFVYVIAQLIEVLYGVVELFRFCFLKKKDTASSISLSQGDSIRIIPKLIFKKP